MGAPDDRSARLDELDRRIRAARKAREPKRGKTGEKFAMANMAWRMTLELVVGGMVGAAMGWGLDVLLGTMPLFLIVFVLLGFAAGIRTVMRSAQEVERQQAAEAAETRKAAEAAERAEGASRREE
jgi:ATP synthase protein I